MHRRQALPLRQSEVACIQLTPRRQLLWAIAENHSPTVEALTFKIQSKMDVSKFFAGFISLLLAFVLSRVGPFLSSDDNLVSGLAHTGIILVLLSLGFCVATLFSYDRLLMPSVFWSGRPFSLIARTYRWIPRRPPTQRHWILYFNMIRTWRYLFTPAVMLLFGGLGALLLAIIGPPFEVVIPVMILALFVPFLAAKWFQPSLGFDD